MYRSRTEHRLHLARGTENCAQPTINRICACITDAPASSTVVEEMRSIHTARKHGRLPLLGEPRVVPEDTHTILPR